MNPEPLQQKWKPISHGEVPLLRRAAMIGYWWYRKGNGKDQKGNGWQTLVEVAVTFAHPPSTVNSMIQKVKLQGREAIGEHEGMLMAEGIREDRMTLDNMLGALQDAKRQGQPQVIPNGSTTSQLLEAMAIKDQEHWDMPCPDLANPLGIAGARSTIQHDMHNHHSSFRRKPRENSPLATVQQADHIRLAEEGLQLPQHAIIFSDEMWVEFNSTHWKKNQSWKHGSNPYLHVDKKDTHNGTNRVIVWAAIAKGFKSQLHIYTPDDILSPEDQCEVIQQANEILKEHTQRWQDAAHHPGTDEFRILQDTNANIELCNMNENCTGRNKKWKRKAEQLLKERPVPNTITCGEVNWSVYRHQVVHS